MADSHLLREEHFDDDTIDGCDTDSKYPSVWAPRQAGMASRFSQWIPWIIHLLLFSINGSLLVVLALRSSEFSKSHSLQTDPFYDSNHFGKVVQQIGVQTDFQGRPSSVNDNYWDETLYSMYI